MRAASSGLKSRRVKKCREIFKNFGLKREPGNLLSYRKGGGIDVKNRSQRGKAIVAASQKKSEGWENGNAKYN
ncbi:MAG TPA: hypothetical protein PLO61_05860 [Fimbriimonadaceae bacterium]|nr:hypothetical protein [Fimbriimonadaceae bacterium]HRJ33356.1 hypothetical protein [Fimbriimonadaceae bacterium]